MPTAANDNEVRLKRYRAPEEPRDSKPSSEYQAEQQEIDAYREWDHHNDIAQAAQEQMQTMQGWRARYKAAADYLKEREDGFWQHGTGDDYDRQHPSSGFADGWMTKQRKDDADVVE